MPAARRQLTLGQLTEEMEGMRRTLTSLQAEVSKLTAVQRTIANCIKALWLVVSPILIAAVIHWIKK